jgi:hypothetical protein
MIPSLIQDVKASADAQIIDGHFVAPDFGI